MTQTLDQLNQDYALASQLQFAAGKGDFPMIEINNRFAQATISVYGGQLLSFQPVGEAKDVLFLSPNAYYAPGKAIKGGAPVCWPWFGPDPEGKGRPQHGFARNRPWEVQSTETLGDGSTKVVLGFSDDEETRALWDHAFKLAIAITIGKAATLELVTRNTGNQPFSITQALHTYFTVGDISKVKVVGFDGKQYIDKVDGGVEKSQSGAIEIDQEVDRIYKDVPPTSVIEDAALGRRIKVDSEGSKTAVVWNPWVDISEKSGDLEDDSYKTMVCVETVNAANEVIEVAAGGEYKLVAVYAAEPNA